MTGHRTVSWILMTGVLVALPRSAGAQVQIALTPHLGYFSTFSEVGAAAPAGPGRYLTLSHVEPALSAGLSLDASWPTSIVGLRITGLTTHSGRATGSFSCYPWLACPAIFLGATVDVRHVIAAADAVVRLGQGVARPHLVVGGGLDRRQYSWPDAVVFVDGDSYAETVPSLRAGLGLDIDLFGGGLRAEALNYWSPAGEPLVPSAGANRQRAPGRKAQHHFGLNVGWRLPLF
jgi:hypothetical protein